MILVLHVAPPESGQRYELKVYQAVPRSMVIAPLVDTAKILLVPTNGDDGSPQLGCLPRKIGVAYLTLEELRVLKSVAQMVAGLTSKVSVTWVGTEVTPAPVSVEVTALLAPVKRLAKRWL